MTTATRWPWFLAAALAVTSCSAPVPYSASVVPAPAAGLPVPAQAQQAVVVRPVDGDTVVLRGRGSGPLTAEPTRVRLLLVDTPEVSGDPECFGAEAAARARQLLPDGTSVRVQRDLDPEDRFGRALLHVWNADGVEVGQALLLEGLATVLVVAPNTGYLDAYRAAEAVARRDGLGLWSACP